MNDDFLLQISEIYNPNSAWDSVSLNLSTNSLGRSTNSLSSSGGIQRDSIDASEIIKTFVVPRAIKLFGRRAALIRCVQIAIVASGVFGAFFDNDFAEQNLSKGSAKKANAYEFVQFVQQLLPFIGFSLTPLSFKPNGTCLPENPVWFDQRRIGWKDVHRLRRCTSYSSSDENEVYLQTMLGHSNPLSKDMADALKGDSVYFNLNISSDECNLTPIWSSTLINEFVPHCAKNMPQTLEKKRINLESVAKSIADRDSTFVTIIIN